MAEVEKPDFNDPRIERLVDLAERHVEGPILQKDREALRWAIGLLRRWPS